MVTPETALTIRACMLKHLEPDEIKWNCPQRTDMDCNIGNVELTPTLADIPNVVNTNDPERPWLAILDPGPLQQPGLRMPFSQKTRKDDDYMNRYWKCICYKNEYWTDQQNETQREWFAQAWYGSQTMHVAQVNTRAAAAVLRFCRIRTADGPHACFAQDLGLQTGYDLTAAARKRAGLKSVVVLEDCDVEEKDKWTAKIQEGLSLISTWTGQSTENLHSTGVELKGKVPVCYSYAPNSSSDIICPNKLLGNMMHDPQATATHSHASQWYKVKFLFFTTPL